MKLWELRPAPDAAPWTSPDGKVLGFIVRAESETAARMLAREEARGEGGFVWLDEKLATCTELLPDGDAAVVMAYFYVD
jgi:hypothetical protein